jgi:hypothetical protein
LRNFDSILRPFFVFAPFSRFLLLHFLQRLQTIKQHHRPFHTAPAPDKSTHSNLLDLSTLGFFLAQVQYSRFSILTVFNQYSRFPPLFPTSQTASTRSNLLAFYPRLFVTQVQYPRFSILTVPPVFPTSSITRTTPRLVRLHQHRTNNQNFLPTAPSLHKFNIHGFSTCIPKYLQCFNQLHGTFFRLRH